MKVLSGLREKLNSEQVVVFQRRSQAVELIQTFETVRIIRTVMQ